MGALRPEDVFSNDTTRATRQGDIFLSTGIARIAAAGEPYSPPAWAAYETTRAALPAGLPGQPDLDVIGGRALVMVVSHDCHLDKELNLAARALPAADPALDESEAYARAEVDDTLDRHVVVSPLVSLGDLPLAFDANTAGLLRAGRIIGYLPVPANSALALPETVVDLGHRSTVDRLTLTQRLSSLTDPARLQLRYALARMDSLRTPDLGAELEAAIGHRIVGVERPAGKRPTVLLRLDDDTALELLPRPGETPHHGPRRQHVPT